MPTFNVDAVAYRSGKRLTLVVALGSAVLLMGPPLRAVLTGQVPLADTVHGGNRWVNLAFSGLILVSVCWCAWRGGSVSTGCLTFLYSLGVVGFVLSGTVGLLIFIVSHHPREIRLDFAGLALTGFGKQVGDTLSFLGMAAWTGFAFWVLVYSQDARFYRHTRRNRLADAFPPPGRAVPPGEPGPRPRS